MDRMLILACSRRKRLDEDLLPAIERYDGPAFRVLRRFLRERPSEAPHVLILSAEHGLIAHDMPIATYDRKMTLARVRELRPSVLAELDRIVEVQAPRETLIFAGRHYLAVLEDEDAFAPALNARACPGPLGKKLAELHDWLYGAPPKLRYNSNMLAEGNRVQFRGIEICLTADEALDVAMEALASKQGNPERYESWYVEVGVRRVAPKWLVSQLTGMPMASFHTNDARRVLQQLGLKVRRT